MEFRNMRMINAENHFRDCVVFVTVATSAVTLMSAGCRQKG